jgi:hypothetical protein
MSRLFRIGLLAGLVLMLALASCSEDEAPVTGESGCRMTGTVTTLGGTPLLYQGGTYD